MFQLRDVHVWSADLRLAHPYRIAGELIDCAHNVFVILEDRSGYLGIGAGAPMPEVTGERMDGAIALAHRMAESLRHRQFADLDGAISALQPMAETYPATMAAFDMALYDLLGKIRGLPVVDLLGRQHRGLMTSVTIGILPEYETRSILERHLRHGFKAIKLKIGDHIEQDIAMVRLLREWGGTGFELRVDANQGYQPDELIRFFRETRGEDVACIEQPLVAPGAESMALIPEEIRACCMADEDIISIRDAEILTDGTPYGAWNLKLMKSGGIHPLRRIAARAENAGIRLMWGCNDESRVCIAAALHAALSTRATTWLDLDGAFDIAHDAVTGGFAIREGALFTLDAPGFGVTLEDVP